MLKFEAGCLQKQMLGYLNFKDWLDVQILSSCSKKEVLMSVSKHLVKSQEMWEMLSTGLIQHCDMECTFPKFVM